MNSGGFATRKDGKMKIVTCECGESFWLNERGWPSTCDLCGKELKHVLTTQPEPVAKLQCSAGLSLLPLDEDKLKTVIREILKEEQWEGGTLIEYEAMAVAIRKFHKWLCEQTEAKR
jgi:hypothetical protein